MGTNLGCLNPTKGIQTGAGGSENALNDLLLLNHDVSIIDWLAHEINGAEIEKVDDVFMRPAA